jgi:hypothetical protein
MRRWQGSATLSQARFDRVRQHVGPLARDQFYVGAEDIVQLETARIV